MGCFFLLPYFSFHLLLLITQFSSYTFSLCNHHDNYALLQFKNSFAVNTSAQPQPQPYIGYIYWPYCSSYSFKTESWKSGTDCCEWDGVTCNTMSGHVIGLDLSCGNLKGEFHPNSTIFQLKHLQTLNLAFNNFSGSSIFPGIGDLVNLTHLNLSHSEISGHIPSTISHLSKLVSLDLSMIYSDVDKVILDQFTWKKLILNATNLRELHLDGVNMSSIRESSLSLLTNLSSSLVSLSLSHTGLQGNFTSYILSLPNLQELDLSSNQLSGLVPPSLWNLTQLTHLDLTGNNLNGEIPSLLSSLTHLTFFDLSGNNFSGHIPDVFGNLIKLEFLALSSNNLSGQVPSSLFNLTQLSILYLSGNNLVGLIPTEITQHSKLEALALGNNMLNGTIPQWCYSLPSLLWLYLSGNQLTGSIGEFSTYSLEYLYLSNNKLEGDFPNSIFELENLTSLHLSSMNLSGPVDFHQFSKCKKLKSLDLSHNSFLFINVESSTDSILLPNLQSLALSSCNLNSFPKFLAQVQNLQSLDLSNNKIHGKLPAWFHEKLLKSWKDIYYIDLSFNRLQGDLPILPYGTQFFFASNNNFTGDIASTLCNASSLIMLNLAHNNLTGTIPQCLGRFPSLFVLDLQINNLYGSVPGSFSKGNVFETIKLNGNQLEGPLPKSLAHCTKLEVLDLGDNNIEDTFPSWLGALQDLQVLSFQSNKLHGAITCSSIEHPFPKLRIFDVSNNNFSGHLPTSCIKNFQGMMNVNESQIGLQYMGKGNYYNDSVAVIIKGLYVELKKILITFTTIDLSYNMFEGEIPRVIGELNSLKGLNLSHNGINGTIPKSLSNLKNLEWLDLSWNQLMGEIPMALTNLSFLSFLNLSQNQLKGIIPTGAQFNTFGNDSYKGNPMLCGFPLSKSCKNVEEQPPHTTFDHEEESGFGWNAVAIGYACGAVFGMLLGYIVFLTGKPRWLARLVQSVFNIRIKRSNNRASANRRGMN